MFVLFCWFIYNVTMIDYVTIAPLIINFAYILFMFLVLWDLRDPNGHLQLVKYYSYFRIFTAFLMTIFAITCFILIFVYVANPALEGTVLSMGWVIAFFLFFTPASVVQWGTIITLRKTIQIMEHLPGGGANSRSPMEYGKADPRMMSRDPRYYGTERADVRYGNNYNPGGIKDAYDNRSPYKMSATPRTYEV